MYCSILTTCEIACYGWRVSYLNQDYHDLTDNVYLNVVTYGFVRSESLFEHAY